MGLSVQSDGNQLTSGLWLIFSLRALFFALDHVLIVSGIFICHLPHQTNLPLHLQSIFD